MLICAWVGGAGRGRKPRAKREEAYLCSTIHCRSFVPLSTPRTLPPSHTAASFLSLTSSTAGICRSGTRLVGWYFGGEYSLYDTDKYYSADDTCLFPPLLPYSQLTLMLISALLNSECNSVIRHPPSSTTALIHVYQPRDSTPLVGLALSAVCKSH